MFPAIRSIGLGFLGLILVTGSSWASAIQGEVKGPDGKAVKGADVRIECKAKKGWSQVSKTDQQGRYVFKNLALGEYTIHTSAPGMAMTTSEQVFARTDGAVRIDFNLKNQGGPASKTSATVARVATKHTHKVWIAGDTGSNIGGHYVDVTDDGEIIAQPSAKTSVNNLDRASGDVLRNTMTNSAMTGGGGH